MALGLEKKEGLLLLDTCIGEENPRRGAWEKDSLSTKGTRRDEQGQKEKKKKKSADWRLGVRKPKN